MEEEILEFLKSGEMNEGKIVEKLSKSEDISLFILYNTQRRSCEVRITLSKLIRSKKISFDENTFLIRSS